MEIIYYHKPFSKNYNKPVDHFLFLLAVLSYRYNLARSTPFLLRGDLRSKHVVLFIFCTEFIIKKLTRIARSSFKGGTLRMPFLLRIFCLFCRYVTVFKDYSLLGYLLKYDFNSVSISLL